MKVIVFSGGVGTRFWPASRRKFPKQFHAVVGQRSLLQNRVDSLLKEFKAEDIFISTNIDYVGEVTGQLPEIPQENQPPNQASQPETPQNNTLNQI